MKPSATILSIGKHTGLTVGCYEDGVYYHIELGEDSDVWDCAESINHEVIHAVLFSFGFYDSQFFDALYICGDHHQPFVWFLSGFRYAGLGM